MIRNFGLISTFIYSFYENIFDFNVSPSDRVILQEFHYEIFVDILIGNFLYELP